ncbi:hypothetical protein, partial [Aquicoccus sp.]|uniref:hypothetical protein n=1 Tax=Aquicoccus sp. TaxID=2055851 RepID=UPI003568C7B1
MAKNRPTPTPSPRTRRAAAWLTKLYPGAVPIRLRRIGDLRFQEISFATPRPHVSGARIASDDTPLL